MLRASVLVMLVSLSAGAASAQTTVHYTYEDYAQHKGDSLGDFLDIYPVMGHFVLEFEHDGKVERIHTNRIWGFTYKNIIFRIREDGNMPVRLMLKGNICYYENGLAHLEMQRDHTEEAFFAFGERSYLSKDLQSEIVPAYFSAKDKHSPSTRFVNEHPEFVGVCACIGELDDMDHTRQCVVDFEVAQEEQRTTGQ